MENDDARLEIAKDTFQAYFGKAICGTVYHLGSYPPQIISKAIAHVLEKRLEFERVFQEKLGE